MLYYKWDSIEHENATAISAKQWIEINFSLTFLNFISNPSIFSVTWKWAFFVTIEQTDSSHS